MLSMQLSKRFVQQIVLDGFAFVGILNNLLDCYNPRSFRNCSTLFFKKTPPCMTSFLYKLTIA